jgi:hypothetical protein
VASIIRIEGEDVTTIIVEEAFTTEAKALVTTEVKIFFFLK